MKDCRDDLTRSIDFILSEANISDDAMSSIRNKMITEIDKYEVLERTKEISTVETESEYYIKLYLGTLKIEGKSVKTIKAYGRLLVIFMRTINKPLKDVTTFDIKAWLINRQSTIALRTCENYRSYLSSFYRWMSAESFIDKNPMDRIKPIKFQEDIKLAFTDVEIDSLRSACTNLRERAELELLLSSGARLSELCSLDKQDINMASKELTIRHGKGGKQRKTYVTDLCIYHLTKYLQSRSDTMECMFVSKQHRRINKGTVEFDFKKLGEKANVYNVHPHRFRRTFATSLSSNGMDVGTIQKLMGHTDINTTMRYIATTDSRIRNEYERYA